MSRFDAGKRPLWKKGLYDTPTDGISKKVFDRYKDGQVRRHVQTMERIQQLEAEVKFLHSVIRKE